MACGYEIVEFLFGESLFEFTEKIIVDGHNGRCMYNKVLIIGGIMLCTCVPKIPNITRRALRHLANVHKIHKSAFTCFTVFLALPRIGV